MTFEVELKFVADALDELERRLVDLGTTFAESPVEQLDHYYAHPARDFAATDEALRLRRVGHQTHITYKGKKEDTQTKTRREIEFRVSDFDKARQLLDALGFREVAAVHKTRRIGMLIWDGTRVEIGLDDVTGLGTYVELEVMADHRQMDRARETIISLASRLQLAHPERRSYLELLLDQRQRDGWQKANDDG